MMVGGCLVDWIEVGQDVHGLYKELLSVGSLVMRVEDHLTMQIPGADAELEKVRQKLLGMAEKVSDLIDLIRPADENQSSRVVSPQD